MASIVKKKKNGLTYMDQVHSIMGEILKQYPELRMQDISSFCPVFYPIAIIELSMKEKTYEDFDSVQLPILRLLYLGICDAGIISETLGLSENYINRILKYFEGVELIDSMGNITNLGKESVIEGKKITLVATEQKFQIDALSGSLIRLDQSIDRMSFVDKSETDIKTGHLMCEDGVDIDELESILQDSEQKESFLKKKAGVINSNVELIEDAKLDGLEYAKAYMMKIEQIDEILVWIKRLNPNYSEDMFFSKRYIWMPFAVSNEELRKKLDVTDVVPRQDYKQSQYVKELDELMIRTQEHFFEIGNADNKDKNKNQNKTNIYEDIESDIRNLLNIEKEEKIEIEYGNATKRSLASIHFNNIKKYSDRLIDVLYETAGNDKYVTTSGRLYGHMVELLFDEAIVSVSKKIKYNIDEIGIKKSKLKKLFHSEGILGDVIVNIDRLLDMDNLKDVIENMDE